MPQPSRGRMVPARSARIALYSHDTQGLGHVRRNLLIANALSARDAHPTILLLSGLRETAGFAMPEGVDCLTLPALGKNVEGAYYPRSLGVSMSDLIALRGQIIRAALHSFAPDVLIVDKVPGGALNELLPVLEELHAKNGPRVVLGLREILDEPDAVRREWARGSYEDIIDEHYDRIWVYGDPAVYDTVREGGLPATIAPKVRYSGYLDPFGVAAAAPAAADATVHGDGEEMILCVVGGGRDGVPLARAFLAAEQPAGVRRVLVTGPLMPAPARAELAAIAFDDARSEVLEFVTDPTALMRRADRVIAMGGYNTMCEIVSLGRPALIVPRVEPRTEQLIRTERFAGLGLVDMLHPRDLTPRSLAAWMSAERRSVGTARHRIDLSGTARLPALLADALDDAHPAMENTHAAG